MNTRHMPIASNKVGDIRRYCLAQLVPIYGQQEAQALTATLFEAFVDYSTTALLAHPEHTVNQSDLLRFYWAVEDLKQWRPIQHIVGHVDFCGCRIEVCPDVLIPRPETAEIVQQLLQLPTTPTTVLDLCTGSGCIAISLAKAWSAAKVTAIDLSEKALKQAQHNATINDVTVDFAQCDILDTASLDGTAQGDYDLIISNPPYVMESQRQTMQANVLDYEPAMALFVEDSNALVFYRAIALYAQNHLTAEGLLALEINDLKATETLEMIEENGFEGKLVKDFRGAYRMLLAKRIS